MASNYYTKAQMQFSKKCLIDALLKLLKNKDLNDITVRELVETAGVSRATYYRNYYQMTDIIRDFLLSRPGGFDTLMKPGDHTPFELVDGYFDYLVANKDLFLTLSKRGLMFLLMDMLEPTFSGPFLPIINELGFQEKYDISAFCGGVYKVTADWFAGGMKESKEDMVRYSTMWLTGYHPDRSKR